MLSILQRIQLHRLSFFCLHIFFFNYNSVDYDSISNFVNLKFCSDEKYKAKYYIFTTKLWTNLVN